MASPVFSYSGFYFETSAVLHLFRDEKAICVNANTLIDQLINNDTSLRQVEQFYTTWDDGNKHTYTNPCISLLDIINHVKQSQLNPSP